MFGIIGRGIIAGITLILAIPMLTFVFLVAGIATLYWAIKDGDWCKDAWAELVPMIEELRNIIRAFVLDE